jgi:hypothetical protein
MVSTGFNPNYDPVAIDYKSIEILRKMNIGGKYFTKKGTYLSYKRKKQKKKIMIYLLVG